VDITVSSRHADVSPALRQAVAEKIGRLDRFLEGMDRADVHFSEERNPRISDREVCEVTLEGHGHHVRAKVAAPDQFAAVDLAVGKLEHQLSRLKTKLVRRSHGAKVGVNGKATAVVDVEAEAGDPHIVKVKRFAIKPMPPDEAALQMELLGHSFFFFSNAQTGKAAVVYRRADGDVGLIDEA
jgi:ribosome hibernation promoting factor